MAVVLVWLGTRDYSGAYNFVVLFYVPMAGFLIALLWCVYFTIKYFTK